MLKNHYRLCLMIVSFLFVIGVALSTIGCILEKDVHFLKENHHHKWYQIIYIDEDDQFHIGITFDNGMQIGTIIP